MISILYANIASAFSNNPSTINAAGGYAVWKTPPTLARAYNPLTFERGHFMHRIIGSTTYRMPQSCVPNYAKIAASNTIVFDYSTKSRTYLLLTGTKSGTPKEKLVSAPPSCTTLYCSSDFDVISTIKSISLDGNETGDHCSDDSFIYVRAGYAYEDDQFICSTSGAVLYREWETIENVTLDIKGEYGKSFSLTAVSYKGKVYFDASPVVRNWFAAVPVATADKATPVLDRSLFVRYTAKSGTYEIANAYGKTFLAANAVAQVGESEDMMPYSDGVLTTLPTLYMYKGYPFDYSVLSNDVAFALENGGSVPAYSIARVGFDEDSDFDHLQDENGDDVLNENGDLILLLPSFDIPVNVKCVPVKPFYVRWINALGGIDYWMFCKHRMVKPQVKGSSVFRPYVGDNQNARTNRVPYGLSTENELTCGAAGITRDEFKALSWLPFSPYIEYLDEDLGKWIRLSVTKYSATLDEWEVNKTFEITFALPEINTQF